MKLIIVFIVLHVCESWSTTMTEKQRLWDVRKYGTEEAILTQGKRGKNWNGEDCKINSFMICTLQQILFG